MDLNLDKSKIEAAVIKQIADQLLDEDEGEAYSRYLDNIQKQIDERVDKLFSEKADAIIDTALNDAIKNGFDREYFKVDDFGRKAGDETTISKELSRLVSSYWSEWVDRNGKPTASSYGRVSRAEYLMTKICADDFSEAMKQSAVSVTGSLKDGLRNQLAKQIDTTLDGLFKVKSLQDQGKVEKPY